MIIRNCLLFCLLVLSCKEKTSIDNRSEKPNLIIEGEVINDSLQHFVKISKSTSIYDSIDFFPYDVNLIVISDNKGNIDTLTKYKSYKGIYVTKNILGKVDNTYYLKIVDSNNTYTAQSTMLPVPEIDSIYSNSIIIQDNLVPIIRFKDNINQENYYRYYVVRNNNNTILSYVENDKLFNGSNIDFFPLRENYRKGNKIEFILCSIDKNNYNYFKALYFNLALSSNLYYSNNSPIKENPPTNISGNNVTGYFSAHSKTSIFYTFN